MRSIPAGRILSSPIDLKSRLIQFVHCAQAPRKSPKFVELHR
jgi:hypothetical protein